jgi:hypothetical protein
MTEPTKVNWRERAEQAEESLTRAHALLRQMIPEALYMEAALERIRERHVVATHPLRQSALMTCAWCGLHWPCPDARDAKEPTDD